MSSKIKVLQVIPKLGFGGAETGCYDLAHYLYEQDCKSYIATSGGELLKYVDKKKVKIIAEIGINHGGDISVAKQLIDSAARTGADAVKFQTYRTEKRVSKDSPIFDILKKCELPFEAFKELQLYSKRLNIDFFSTPFDIESVDYLESINVDLYKIASFDIGNMDLLEKALYSRQF